MKSSSLSNENGKIRNPILPGFNPDPSICRVGDDYYIAVSTFEWYPGVRIYHSRDLENWSLAGCPLNRINQLDMRGNGDSRGIWAPALSWCDGLFYLIYTNVRNFEGPCKDTLNYLVTAESVEGEWSDPVFLNGSGFDPSLFHDDDGRKWLVNMVCDFRRGHEDTFFGGIEIQEYSPSARRLVGPSRILFEGTELGYTEGPHLLKKDGFYYLMVAEGGSGRGHCETIARSRALLGDYEAQPDGPFITSRFNESNPLQKAGHGSFVETQAGEWYFVHLCARPLADFGNCPLGRETGLQKVVWEEEWPRLAQGGREPSMEVERPRGLAPVVKEVYPKRNDFEVGEVPEEFQSLRAPVSQDWVSFERSGYLTLRGRESLCSPHDQSLLGRRVESLRSEVSICLEFEPETFQQMAGLAVFYNAKKYYYLHVTHDEELGRVIDLHEALDHKLRYPLDRGLAIGDAQSVGLRASIDHHRLRFAYALEGGLWREIPGVYRADLLSDETFGGGFTGLFFCICCQDGKYHAKTADFDWFEYREG